MLYQDGTGQPFQAPGLAMPYAQVTSMQPPSGPSRQSFDSRGVAAISAKKRLQALPCYTLVILMQYH